MTTKLVLLFQMPPDPHSFELRYTRSVTLLRKLPGLRKTEVGGVIGSPTGDTSYYRILELFFDDFETLDKALTSPDGVAAGKDLMSFAGDIVELLFVESADVAAQRPLSPQNLQAYLDEHDIPAEIVYPGVPTPTVAAAAEALEVEPDQIVKSVVFMVADQPFLVYACGVRRVDPGKLAQRLNVEHKDVMLASAQQVLDLTGYAVGTVPPLGLKTPMPVFMDPAVQSYETIYAGGGGIKALLRMRSEDLLNYSNAEVAPMLRDKPEPHPRSSMLDDERPM